MQVSVTDRERPLAGLTKVTAEISRPNRGFGTFLATTSLDIGLVRAASAVGGEELDLASAKARALFTQADHLQSMRPIRETQTLFDDGDAAHGDATAGDGLFSARLLPAEFPGLVSARISREGADPRLGSFSRQVTASTPISLGDLVLEASQLEVQTIAGPPAKILLQLTPRDAHGNFLGPGYADALSATLGSLVVTGGFEDHLDGSYSREIDAPVDLSGSTPLNVSVDGDQIFDGVIEDVGQPVPWWWLMVVLILALILLLWFVARRQSP